MSQTITFDRWILYGSGFTQSYQAKVTISVSRSYGSDVATVSGTAQMSSYGGDTNTTWTFWIKIGSTWYSKTLPTGTHWAGDWYSTNFSWNISVGATAGSLSGQVTFQAYDTGAGVEAYSAYKDWSQSYGTKGASTISSASNVTLSTSGSVNSTIGWNAYSSSFTYVLTASLGSASASATYNNLSGNVSKTLGFGSSFISAITNAKSASVTVTLTTKSGNTTIGTSTKNITLTVPSGINPSVTITTQKVSALSQTYFSGKYCTLIDKMTVSLTTSTQYSATISSRAITANGESFNASPATTSALTNYGTNNINASVTDSRGNSSGTVTETVNVYWYFYPTVTAKYRHATNYLLDISGRIAYVGGDQTTKTLRLAIYKGTTLIQNNINLDSYIATNASGGTYDGYLNISGEYTIPDEYITDIATDTYEFRLTVSDTVSSATSSAYSGIAVMTFGAGGTDVTVHKPVEFEQGVLIHEVESFDYEIHTFKSAISAGTIGTRGAQQSYTPSYTVRSVEICHVSNSMQYIPIAWVQTNNNIVYCNWYRAQSSAVTEANSEVRVKIYKG